MSIKRIYIIIVGLIVTLLTGCGDVEDSKDIHAAKKLFKSFANKVHIRSKGYIDKHSLIYNLEEADYWSQANSSYQRPPQSFYFMRHIGCLSDKRKRFLTEEHQQTAADIVVGVVKNKVYYIQKNRLTRDHCYMGHIGFQGSINILGMPVLGAGQVKGIGKLPKNVCSSGLEPNLLVSRIDASQVKRMLRDQLYSQNRYSPYQQNKNFTPHWFEDEDAYYHINVASQGVVARNNKFGTAEWDSFKSLRRHEGLFISATLRSNSSHPSCVKDVYWGFRVNPSSPPYVTIDELSFEGDGRRRHGRQESTSSSGHRGDLGLRLP